MTLVAGIDSSTQSCKIVIRDASTGELVRSGSAPHPAGTSVDPNAWWDALLAAIEAAGGLDGVAAIAVAGQQHGMVTLSASGEIVRDALLWNDTRSAAAASALLDEFGADEMARRTGLLPVASFTATKVRWLRDAEPSNASRVAAVALPHDWLTWRLLGYGPVGSPDDSDGSPLGPDLDALVTDRSDASGTSYWTPSTGEYDLELFEAAFGRAGRAAEGAGSGAEADRAHGPVILPRVLGPSESAGRTVAHASIPADVVVGPGMGDNAGAALGLDAHAGDVVISIGTSGTAFAVTPTATTDPSGVVAGFADATGAFLPLIATLNAARILTSVETLLGVDHDEFARLALAASPGAGGLALVPYFEGERTPNLPGATATLAGLTLGATTRENLARAGVEGLICSLADGMDAVRALGVTADRVLLTGGAAFNAAVQQVASEVFDVPVAVPNPGEYVADGAARQAAWVLSGTRPAWPVAIAATLTPAPQPAVRARYAAAQGLGSVPRVGA